MEVVSPGTISEVASLLIVLRDHPIALTMFSIVVVICVALVVTVPKILRYNLAIQKLRAMENTGSKIAPVREKPDETALAAISMDGRPVGEPPQEALKMNDPDERIGMDLGYAARRSAGLCVSSISIQLRELQYQIAVVTLYTKSMPSYDRMFAALIYFSLGGNHNAEDFVVTDVIMKEPNGVKLWNSAVNHFCQTQWYSLMDNEARDNIRRFLKEVRSQIR